MAQEIRTIFPDEELSAFDGQIKVRAPHYIEIECGCTSKRFGDSVGIMRISDDGAICTTCNCNESCNQVFNSPAKFAKHASNSTSVPNWRTKIWVQNFNGERIKLRETCLLRYYKGDEYVRPDSQFSHRDEFLRCSVCNKVRRFTFKTSEALGYYHNALIMENRTCKDMIPGMWTCEDLEERSSRPHSGCHKKTNCKGCKYCVCFGCKMCRIEGCKCRVCTDFYANVPN